MNAPLPHRGDNSRTTARASMGAVKFCAADQRAELHIDLSDAVLAELAARAVHSTTEADR